MKLSRPATRRTLLAFACSCASFPCVFAQDVPTIVVTGTVLPRTLGSEFAATSVLTRDDLQRTGRARRRRRAGAARHRARRAARRPRHGRLRPAARRRLARHPRARRWRAAQRRDARPGHPVAAAGGRHRAHRGCARQPLGALRRQRDGRRHPDLHAARVERLARRGQRDRRQPRDTARRGQRVRRQRHLARPLHRGWGAHRRLQRHRSGRAAQRQPRRRRQPAPPCGTRARRRCRARPCARAGPARRARHRRVRRRLVVQQPHRHAPAIPAAAQRHACAGAMPSGRTGRSNGAPPKAARPVARSP